MAGAKKLSPAEHGTEIQIVHQTPPAEAAKEIAWREAEAATMARAQAMAESLGYDEELSLPVLEDRARFYGRRAVEDFLELGKTLLLIKELAPHGEFEQRVERLGFPPRAARKFMQAAAKAANSAKLAALAGRVKNPSVFVELIALDDDTLEEFSEMDDIESLTGPEAKRRIRDLLADIEAKDERAAKREQEIERKTAEIARLKRQAAKATPDELAVELREKLSAEALGIEAMIVADGKDCSSLRTRIRDLVAHGEEHGHDHMAFLAGAIAQIERTLRIVRDEYGIAATPSGDPTPDWIKEGQQAGVIG